MIKNLSQFKKWAAPGKRIHFIENNIKPDWAGEIREIAHVQTNCLTTWRNGKKSWLDFPKAKDMVFHEDGTIDFLDKKTGEMLIKMKPLEEVCL